MVSDGSRDNTAVVAAKAGALVVNLPQNRGKGGAMLAGVKQTDADYILFLDADLIGLKQSHIESMLAPVLQGRAEVTLGVFKKGRVTTDLAQKFAPYCRVSGSSRPLSETGSGYGLCPLWCRNGSDPLC